MNKILFNDYVNSKAAREALKVTTGTLHRWDKEGKIHTVRTPSNQRLYNKKDILNIIGGDNLPAEKKSVLYARVSSKKQSNDLKRQSDFLISRYPDSELVTDIGSGINWRRKGLQTILELAMSGHLKRLVVTHRDRLCRFAFELIEWILSKNQVELIVLDREDDKPSSKELADDILSIVHVYSCREMGRRRYKQKDFKDPEIPDLSNSYSKVEINFLDGN